MVARLSVCRREGQREAGAAAAAAGLVWLENVYRRGGSLEAGARCVGGSVGRSAAVSWMACMRFLFEHLSLPLFSSLSLFSPPKKNKNTLSLVVVVFFYTRILTSLIYSSSSSFFFPSLWLWWRRRRRRRWWRSIVIAIDRYGGRRADCCSRAKEQSTR
ncbi:hypothetical protein BKA80DRAFT_112847 [Phyllosticta citrichinensis]